MRRWNTLWSRVGYRPWARLLHRFALHHTQLTDRAECGRWMPNPLLPATIGIGTFVAVVVTLVGLE